MMAQSNIVLPELVENLNLVTAPGGSGLHWVWYVAGVVALLALVIPLYLAFRPRKEDPSRDTRPVGPDPAIVANERLNRLRNLMGEMTQREAAIELASILRDYIGGRFDIRAPYQTTGEFVRNLRLADHFPSTQAGSVVDLLNTFDLIKFATGIMQEGTLLQWIDYVGEFIQNTPGSQPAADIKPEGTATHG